MSGEREQVVSQELLPEVAKGSVEAYASLYDCYAPLVFRIAFHLTGSKEEAEDVCQDVFLSVWHQASRYDSKRGSVEAWLYVQTRSRALDLLRSRAKNVPLSAAPAIGELLENKRAADDPTSAQVLVNLLKQSLHRAVSQLPEAQRQALTSAYLGGHSHYEIADGMKRPLGTIKSLIRYGLQKVRRQLREEGWETDSYEGRRSS